MPFGRLRFGGCSELSAHTESVRNCDDCACMHDDNEVRVSERRLYDVTLPLSDMVLCFQRM